MERCVSVCGCVCEGHGIPNGHVYLWQYSTQNQKCLVFWDRVPNGVKVCKFGELNMVSLCYIKVIWTSSESFKGGMLAFCQGSLTKQDPRLHPYQNFGHVENSIETALICYVYVCCSASPCSSLCVELSCVRSDQLHLATSAVPHQFNCWLLTPRILPEQSPAGSKRWR